MELRPLGSLETNPQHGRRIESISKKRRKEDEEVEEETKKSPKLLLNTLIFN